MNKPKRDHWSSRIGIIMAVAGSAVGLGNFLRFPAKVAANGGGAFMIPYFISLFLLGIPLMWVEWTLGRYGGGFGHGTAPGIFHSVWQKNRFIKYFGIIGIFGPVVIFTYYVFIQSWTLGYSLFAIFGRYAHIMDETGMKAFLLGYQGIEKNTFFQSIIPAYTFFLVTFAINMIVVFHGIKGGIERFCKIAMPLLFVFSSILLIRVLMLGTPNPAKPDWNISNGFGFVWNPDFSQLLNGKIWLEAAGQIFFTLSVGIGVILTYASYLSKGDDVALSGATAVSTNELAEVILGGSIILPAAFVFFGPAGAQSIAESGIFNLGFVTMPLIINRLPFSELTGFLWFSLLFLAGITSSISLSQPAIAFMEDEFNFSRKKAVCLFGLATFILCQPAIFFLRNGVVDELDFWGGTFFLVIFATVEVILFSWVFGMDKAWDEIHQGADIQIPTVYKFILKYITPLFLFTILAVWFWQEWRPIIFMQHISADHRVHIFLTRLILFLILLFLAIAVRFAWNKRSLRSNERTKQ
jgi:neurotransmitter:Na+ symporter, NSS family